MDMGLTRIIPKATIFSISCMNGEEAVSFVADFEDKVIALNRFVLFLISPVGGYNS